MDQSSSRNNNIDGASRDCATTVTTLLEAGASVRANIMKGIISEPPVKICYPPDLAHGIEADGDILMDGLFTGPLISAKVSLTRSNLYVMFARLDHIKADQLWDNYPTRFDWLVNTYTISAIACLKCKTVDRDAYPLMFQYLLEVAILGNKTS